MPSLTTGIEIDARLEGFADAEELIAGMLERMAASEEAKMQGWSPEVQARGHRAGTLREAALAVRLGQHRDEPEVRP
jgi:hypothetical protein